VDRTVDVPARAVESCPRLAAGLVETVRERSGLGLDYSAGSLALVDRMVDGLRQGRRQAVDVGPTLTALGAYTGEVLVRAIGAAWVEFDADQQAVFGQQFGIRTPDGRLWNPLGKAVKRYENGPRDSLRLFGRAVVGRTRG
jgi:hypothetical protein